MSYCLSLFFPGPALVPSTKMLNEESDVWVIEWTYKYVIPWYFLRKKCLESHLLLCENEKYKEIAINKY